MNFDVLTIFPEMFDGFWQHGIIRRALEGGQITGRATNIRDFAKGRHKVTDDRPYGGGCGMVMKPEPLAGAIRAAGKRLPQAKTVLLTPQGRAFNQEIAREFAELKGLILVCGRYEGVDERIGHDFIDDEISIGDYVLTGGELGAMVLIDAVTRLIPGTLGGIDSAEKDSFSQDLLEHAHFTRPRLFEGREVPDVLVSGNHAAIETWRMETSLIRTFLKRPDLLKAKSLSSSEIEILKKWCLEIEKIIQAQSVCGTDTLSGVE
ncbi:MAG: tRNA (guanosine(37)-N1)-methyltransferase TrmD [Deltaproteobacteria bacterium]|nr:tRNA (guanosine(37)-N1)-methyltransferase TrmD [Deltaproteobacteria bacterium]MBW2591520.1 tRNA (guanosine(37)-N1)-methyltransferase TrmD [Deltaproteobacteria bacterium]